MACDPSIEDGLAFAIGRSVEYVPWLEPCVRGKLRTGLCGACTDSPAVASAVDRSTVNGSVVPVVAQKIDMLTCVPYA